HPRDLAAAVDLGAPAIVAAHDDPQQLPREVRLQLPPWLNSHLSKISLSKARLAVDAGDGCLGQAVALILFLEAFEALPRDLDVVGSILQVLPRQRRPVFDIAQLGRGLEVLRKLT